MLHWHACNLYEATFNNILLLKIFYTLHEGQDIYLFILLVLFFIQESPVSRTVPAKRRYSMNICWMTKLIIGSGGKYVFHIVIELCFLQQSLKGIFKVFVVKSIDLFPEMVPQLRIVFLNSMVISNRKAITFTRLQNKPHHGYAS